MTKTQPSPDQVITTMTVTVTPQTTTIDNINPVDVFRLFHLLAGLVVLPDEQLSSAKTRTASNLAHAVFLENSSFTEIQVEIMNIAIWVIRHCLCQISQNRLKRDVTIFNTAMAEAYQQISRLSGIVFSINEAVRKGR